MSVLTQIGSDFRNIRRDPMLFMAMSAPVLLFLLVYFGFPALNAFLLHTLNASIADYYTFACVFMLSLIPMMFGMVYGFILLDERDEGLITYYSITPVGKSGYLRMRMTAPVLFSFVVILLFVRFLNFDNGLIWWKHIPLAFITALQAPIMLLFLGGFAENKVAGIAISKGFGLLLMAIIIDYFIQSPWSLLAGISPLVWTARGFFAQEPTHILIYLIAALAIHGIYLLVLFSKFVRVEN